MFTKDGYTRWKTGLDNFKKHVGGLSSRHNIARDDCDDFNNQRASEATKLLENGMISAGTGLHQESSITRPGDTRWGSHLRTLLRIFTMWKAVVGVIGNIVIDAREHTCQGGAFGLLIKMQCFEFVFIMLLLINMLNTMRLNFCLALTSFAKEESKYC